MGLDNYSHSQRERLRFIDFCLQFFGQISRADLLNQFQLGLASGTRDFTLYKELVPDNLKLFHQTKLYYRTESFEPLFAHDADEALIELTRGFTDNAVAFRNPAHFCFDAIRLITPNSDVIAALMRAIQGTKVIACQYVSLSSGEGRRELVPHALVNNGHRWHVRAFDRKSAQFRDFVCSRFTSITESSSAVKLHELAVADHDWQHILSITLVAHPGLTHPLAIELDYGMSNGQLILEVRAALVGYLMQQWQVDCSTEHCLSPLSHQLALLNPEQIEKYNNTQLAPSTGG